MIRKLLHLYSNKERVLGAFLIFFCSSSFEVNAQATIGARELAVGQAITALPATSWGMFANPALISELDKTVSFYGVQYFGFAELSDMAVSVTFPAKIGVLGAGVHRYGFDLFNENRLRLGYKNVFAGFHYGIILNYSHVVQGGGYGSAGAVGVDVGVAASLYPGLWIGAAATNINQPEYGSRNNEKLPRELKVGLSYQLSDIALVTTDLVKDIQFPLSYRGGVEISIIENLTGRAGVTTGPQTFTAGFGYSDAFWSTNIAVQRHADQVLGYSPAIDFKITW